jgi:cyclase
MIRLIARIDARNGMHIKTINCEGTKVLRPLEKSIAVFSKGSQTFDEIILLDNVATLYGRQNWLIRDPATFFFCPIPLSVGGAISSPEIATKTLKSGADKIVINSAAVENPALIEKLAKICGQQAIILQVDAKLVGDTYLCCTHGSRELSKICVKSWISAAQELGAGEIHLTSIDSEGVDVPFPNQLADIASSATKLPIIVSGGISSAGQIHSLNKTFGIDSFSVSSIPNRLNVQINQLRKDLHKLGGTVRWP